MSKRKVCLVSGDVYHIVSRSIAKYVVFNNSDEFSRIIELLNLYRYADFNFKYSRFLTLSNHYQKEIIDKVESNNDVLVKILAYCIMPTHLHLLVKQVKDGGTVLYLSKILNSYSKYFNLKHKRTGPLWNGRFRNIKVNTDEQLLHLTRYIHLNPTSAGLTSSPGLWYPSSYREYIDENSKGFCDFKDLINISPNDYKKFAEDRRSYQRELSIIKNLVIDNYSG